MSIQTTQLDNGLRILTDRVDSVESVALGIWFNVGTRNETHDLNGLAHMVEHLMFGGTAKRSSQQIVEEIEAVGGQVNAYTSREQTAYYIHLLEEQMPLALDIIGDMMTGSIFPDHEIEKERDVILQEIAMTEDIPDDLVYDYYYEAVYQDHPFGRPILGRGDVIRSVTKKDIESYVTQNYIPQNAVIAAAGAVDHDAFVKQVEESFSWATTQAPPRASAPLNPQHAVQAIEKELEQAHLVYGFPSASRKEPDHLTALLLSTYLGGGMSSILFQEVREKHGLAYAIYATQCGYSDTGQFEIYAGTAPNRVEKLIVILENVLSEASETLLSQAALHKIKNQVIADAVMGQESLLGRVNKQAKHMLLFGAPYDLKAFRQRVVEITPSDIQRLAHQTFSQTPNITVLGPKTN